MKSKVVICIISIAKLYIPLWWTEMFEGGASNQCNTFTIGFGDHIFKTMKVQELSAVEKVIWFVKDSSINTGTG